MEERTEETLLQKAQHLAQIWKFKEAETCYIQHFTSSVVHQHLAWAEEQLQEADGDNVKVLALCNFVLQLDRNNEKASFFRAQAHDNLAYLAAKHIPNVLDTGEETPAEGGHEDQRLDSNKWCKKAVKHKEYKSVDKFDETDLPEKWRTKDMLDLVKGQIQLAVLLRVNGASENRPKYIPGTRVRYLNFSEGSAFRGSGFVSYVVFCSETCPCITCKDASNPEDRYAKVFVMTAAHVVFDKKEGENTTCYFDYDVTESELTSCVSLGPAVDVNSDIECDISCVTFVTHDKALAENLCAQCKTFQNLSQKVKWTIGVFQDGDEKDKDLYNCIIELEKKCSDTQQELNQLIDVLSGHSEELSPQIVSSGDENPLYLMLQYGYRLWREHRDTNRVNEILCCLKQHLKTHALVMEDMRALKDGYGSLLSMQGYQNVLMLYQRLLKHLKDLNKELHGITIEPFIYQAMDESDSQPLVRQFYNDKFPLTIIVSHPHKWTKKISIGEIKARKIVKGYDTVSYKYTAATCSGSSGGPVFILGRRGHVVIHPHSLTEILLDREKEAVNESGIITDR